MDWKFWATFAVNVVGVVFAIRGVHIMKQQIPVLPSPRSTTRMALERKLLKRLYTPIFIMGALVILSWLPYIFAGNQNLVLPSMLVGWGGTDKGCSSLIDTSGLVEVKDKYRLFAVCTIPDPTIDNLEDKNFAISKPFYISGGSVSIVISYDPSSAIAAAAKPGTATNHSIVLLPKDQDGTRITKLSDVFRDGGKILIPGAKKPF
jgi:hypothetical protein